MKSSKKKKNIVVKKVNQLKVINKNQSKFNLIIGGVIFLVLAAGIIYFGTKNTENKFNDILSKKPITPTPSINNNSTLPGTQAHPVTSRPIPTTTDIEPTPPSDKKDIISVYLLPMSNSRKITKEDLINFSDLDLKKSRNEIYARYGRSFVSQDMACYFVKQSWYQENPDYNEKLLSSLEISNVIFILNYEKEKQSPYINKDNGCEE
ncbi:MAG: YARHG domain-containing protein [Candidatus Shapirobacteria bacterium]|jgi:hypothetical protein